nr:helix-turn-helix domain-containing protein [Prevotella sp.]
SEVIKEETGISALKWITDYVIIQAKMLLDSHQHLTIQQISHRLGFTEQSSFSRYFKANTGMTPSEYRRKE